MLIHIFLLNSCNNLKTQILLPSGWQWKSRLLEEVTHGKVIYFVRGGSGFEVGLSDSKAYFLSTTAYCLLGEHNNEPQLVSVAGRKQTYIWYVCHLELTLPLSSSVTLSRLMTFQSPNFFMCKSEACAKLSLTSLHLSFSIGFLLRPSVLAPACAPCSLEPSLNVVCGFVSL